MKRSCSSHIRATSAPYAMTATIASVTMTGTLRLDTLTLLPRCTGGITSGGAAVGLQIGLRIRLGLRRCHLVGVEADHQVGDVIVDLREAMARAGGDDHDIALLQVMEDPVVDRLGIVARAIEQAHGVVLGVSPLLANQIRAQLDRARS